jgi:putative phosphoesterase
MENTKMINKKIAVISDIHGNSIALSEVLKDIQKKEIDTIINLGDSLYGPLDPKGTFNLLESNNVISISGNQDRIIRENLDNKSHLITLEYVKSQLDNKIVEWLKQLPFDTVIDNDIFCFHASPHNDSEYLLEKLNEGFISIKDIDEIEKLLIDIKQKIILCGHSHISKIVETNNKLIVNPGSVGLAAYDDELPVYHKMQNFNPRANYAVINILGESVSIERMSLDYDFEKSAKLAEKNKRDDWAKWIRTGKV